jgi:hypothetical protein
MSPANDDSLRIPRRQFLATAAGAGIGLPAMLNAANLSSAPAGTSPTLEAGRFAATFSTGDGTLSISRDGAPLLAGCTPRVLVGDSPRSTAEAAYAKAVQIRAVEDRLGKGRQLVATCKDGRQGLDLEVRVTLYPTRDAVTVETLCRNASSQDLVLTAIEPLFTGTEASGSGLLWPGCSKVLTNGKMYYDAGRVLDFPRKETPSWWNVGLYRGEREPGLAIGYVENSRTLGRIHLRPGATDQTPAVADAKQPIGLTARSILADCCVLRPGQQISSERVIFQFADDPFTSLERYAQAMADVHDIRLNPIVNGWCSWFSFFGDITEDEVVRQAEFAARHLKPYGFEYIQVDDGFYRAFGDWEGNDKFPHGMKWLAERIRKLGLKPGIWFAPYAISRGTEVYEKHPDWLVHTLDGRLKACGPNLTDASPELKDPRPQTCSLDVTHPDAAAWLGKLFRTAAEDWGYDFIKIDFVDWTLLSAPKYHDPTVSQAAAYRRGAEIMRAAMGPKRHLLDCGPGPVSVGLLDSMRIELDQPPVTWNQYFLQPASSGPAAAKRYYFHNRTWINDDDHVVLTALTPEQAQAAASVVGLSGGTMMSGDRMSDLDPVRLEILRKAFPSYGQAARPVDLFERDRPEVFALNVERPFGKWIVLGLFNADEQQPCEKRIDLERLRLDPAKTYVAFDFWRQRLFGEIKGTLTVPLAPASCTLLAIHERPTVPKVISTDRHFTQGGVELEDVKWEAGPSASASDGAPRAADSDTLRGVSLGPRGSSHNVYIYLPQPRPWGQGHPFFFYDFGEYTLHPTEANVMRVQVRFDKAERVEWAVNPERYFAGGKPKPL